MTVKKHRDGSISVRMTAKEYEVFRGFAAKLAGFPQKTVKNDQNNGDKGQNSDYPPYGNTCYTCYRWGDGGICSLDNVPQAGTDWCPSWKRIPSPFPVIIRKLCKNCSYFGVGDDKTACSILKTPNEKTGNCYDWKLEEKKSD